MNKKSLNRRSAQQFILDGWDQGKSNQQLYNELSEQYYGKKAIALLITGTPTKVTKAQYRIYNNILLGLLGVVILARIWLVFAITIESKQALMLVLILITPLFAALFAFEIARYNAPIYRLCAIMTIVGFVQSLTKAEGFTVNVINFIIAGAIVTFSIYLDAQLFPNFSPKKLKIDSNGEYVFDQAEKITSEK